ncbi:serine hydrolase domain-containing protein [Pseudonocardia nantongensis]|uniref:serine hydrolase domain-containing protein n=1 Tax=Pseudonocardia nantongensis TaxID=1181885 RepID=UPI0039795E21
MIATGSSTVPAAGRGTLAAALAGAVLLGVLGWLLAPAPSSPGPEQSGDPALAERLRAAAGPGQYGVVAAVVEGGAVTYAGIGDDGRGTPVSATTPFEIGSVTKTMTGAVLAGLERQGVVDADDRVREVVPGREWGPVGDVTLGELVSHRSGLPRLASGFDRFAMGLGYTWFGTDPYDSSPEDVFASADAAGLGPRGEPEYSNLANALLGQVLAARTGTPYPQLVEQIVTGPLGMTATAIPDASPPGAAVGHDEAGRAVAPWISPGDVPGGVGVWSTAEDLVRYAGALDAPGSPVADAAVPRYPSDFGRIGYGWYTLETGGHTLLWKNGGSGGVSSSVLAEPATGSTVVVLGNSEAGVDRIGAELLGVPPPSTARTDDAGGVELPGLVPVLVAIVFPLSAGTTVLGAARGGWRRAPASVRRTDVGTALGTGLFFLVVAWATGAIGWAYVPFWVAGCVLAGAGAGLAVARWRDWGPDHDAGAGGRRASAAFGLVLGLGALAAVVTARVLI